MMVTKSDRTMMRKRMSHALTSCVLLLTAMLLLTSCGTESGRFRLEGRFRNMNQGEFWIYSLDGAFEGIDTIKVRDGRFAYEMDLDDEAILMVVFPNYSEQPVFARSGSTVSIKGDATHLKEMIIQGTDENEDMTTLRLQLNDLTPPDIPDAVAHFIEENPESPVSIYMMQRYFVFSETPDFPRALKLVRLMQGKQPDNDYLIDLERRLKKLQSGNLKAQLPKFESKDIDGKKVSESALRAKANVLLAWATWSYSSMEMLRKVKELKKKYGAQLGVVAICLDGSDKVCRERIAHDSLQWQTVCDGRMWDTPLVSKFAITDVPFNVVINQKGRIVARQLKTKDLETKIEQLIK